MSKTRIFVDTNIILEAFRINCWNALCQKYTIETVEKCIEESLSGNPNNPQHIPVKRKNLVKGLTAIHDPDKKDIANLRLNYPETQGLDDGELHLIAWLYAQKIVPDALIQISTADKAAIVSISILGWLDSVTSLEQLLSGVGITKQQLEKLREQYCSNWLKRIKTKICLNSI